MAITDSKVRNAKPKDKQYKLSAGQGLYLIVSPRGGKWWRVRYRFGGKQKELSVGTYTPTSVTHVSLKAAIARRDEIRLMVSEGIDPSYKRKIESLHVSNENSFEGVGREWHSKFSANWTEKYAQLMLTRLEQNAFPWLGGRNVNEITAPELLAVLRRIESRGALETTHRVHRACSQIFRYAIATGRAERDPAADLQGAIPPAKTKHHASITEPKAIGGLIRATRDYHGTFVTACALKLAPYVFVRPVELRKAEWSEIDLENAEWRLPPEKMKMRVLHVVPLSKQAIEIFREIQPLTGTGKYVFPCSRSASRAMSENTINASLRRIGYTKDEMTAHGFRSMASTLLNELGWNGDAIERQLAHSESNGVRATYNYAQHLPERKEMMQFWADYLDKLAGGADVVPIKQGNGDIYAG